jgi:hypothetical protein
MKNIALLLIGLIVLVSCDKESDSPNGSSCTKGEENYSNNNGATLNLTSQEWYLEENELGGVNGGVNIVGSIEGDSATIRTAGDGLLYYAKIELNSAKEFNQRIEIFFTSSPLTEEYITTSTLIMVFNGQDTLKTEISSCSLKNIQYQ